MIHTIHKKASLPAVAAIVIKTKTPIEEQAAPAAAPLAEEVKVEYFWREKLPSCCCCRRTYNTLPPQVYVSKRAWRNNTYAKATYTIFLRQLFQCALATFSSSSSFLHMNKKYVCS